ncbi:putative uncharacterized protein [Prevotella sp. CAG:755]|nr:putative uncharacterized protein [Prevotella sp. CAG:755]
MWLSLAFLSAALLGFYDVFKKRSLRDNAVIPVLFLNTLICSLIFMPLIVGSAVGWLGPESVVYIPAGGWDVHKYILVKSFIVLGSWLLGYVGMKHLPLTIVGPINATRPVMTLIGAMLVYGERLNGWQWAGVVLAVVSFLMLSRSGKKEGIRFAHNRWIYCIVGAALLGAVSGLYDKFLMAPVGEGGVGLDKMAVQGWYNVYQCVMMGAMVALLWWPVRRRTAPFRWDAAIPLISIFLTAADLAYFYALSQPGAMISVVSMVRRGSVVVSFLFAALVFKEKNLRAKAVDLVLVLLGMVCLWIGSA